MPTREFETQEEMDDAFETMMEREQQKVRLQQCIETAESNIEDLRYQLEEAEEELTDLRDELEALKI